MSFFGLYFMVFKFLQKFPLSIKSLLFEVLYALILSLFISFFNLSQPAFWMGWLLGHLYVALFFYSAFLLFKRKKSALFFLGLKWLLLLLVLVSVLIFFEGQSFLIGLSGILSFLLCYVLESVNKTNLNQ